MISLAAFQPLKNQPFFINNRGFTERYFSDKVYAILIEEVPVQTTLRGGATKIFISAFKFRAKYSHINLYSLSAKANL